MDRSIDALGVASAATAMTCVGTLTTVSAVIADYPVYGGQAVRYGVAGLVLLAIARLRSRRPAPGPPADASASGRAPVTGRDALLVIALAATGLAAFNVCIIEGTHYTTPATIGTVIGASPIALSIVAPLMKSHRPSVRVVAAAVTVALGAGLANGLGGGSLPGLLLALGALAGEVCFSLLAVPLLPRLGPVRVSAYAASAAAPMLAVVGLVADGRGVLRLPTPAEAAGLAYLTFVVTVAVFVVWYGALGRIGADRAGLFAGLIPVGALVSMTLLGVGTPTIGDAVGVAFVALGVTIGLRPTRLGGLDPESEPANA